MRHHRLKVIETASSCIVKDFTEIQDTKGSRLTISVRGVQTLRDDKHVVRDTPRACTTIYFIYALVLDHTVWNCTPRSFFRFCPHDCNQHTTYFVSALPYESVPRMLRENLHEARTTQTNRTKR